VAFSTFTVQRVPVIRLEQTRMDAGNAESIKTQLSQLLAQCRKAVIDLAQVQYVDAHGLEALLEVIGRFPGHAVLTGVSAPVASLFDLAQLRNVLSIFADLDSAVAALHDPD
jgi:anti-anti-sigma factor